MAKKALGKGLSALIPDKKKIHSSENMSLPKALGHQLTPESLDIHLPIQKIQANLNQPRKMFDETYLLELAESIKENGILQPIIVRKKAQGNHYEIIAGERRFRAAQIAGLKEIPVVIKDVDDVKSLELALVENVQRQDLSVLEEAKAYQSLINEHGLTQDSLAQIIGKNRSSIANLIRVLQLPHEVQRWIQEERLTLGHAKVLLSLKNPAQQRAIAEEVIQKGFNVRQTELLVSSLLKPLIKSSKKKNALDPIIEILQSSLEEQLGTKVKLSKKGKGGKVEISFFSDDDLERILTQMNLSLEAIQ